MKKTFQYLFGKYGFGLIPVGILIYLLFHWIGCCKEDEIKETKSDTVVRVVTHTDTFYHNSNYYHYDTIRTEIPIYIDTNQTIQDYYTYKAIQDSFIGKNYRVLLCDTLYQNSLAGRRATISVTQVDSIINNTVTLKDKPRIKGFAGLTLTSNLDKSYVFVNGGLQTKRENIWILGYDPFNKQLQAGYLHKIKLK